MLLEHFGNSSVRESFLPTTIWPKSANDSRERAPPNLILPEQNVRLQTKHFFLAAWFSLNLILTMCNKAVLAQANFPWLLTTMQLSLTAIGCFGLVGHGALEPAKLDRREGLIMAAFSVLFTVNIAISNVSLGIVSVPLHQLVRSTCPAVTLLFYRMLGRSYSTATYLSIFLLIFGVALATLGDYSCTFTGLAVTFFGVVLAAGKTVATNSIMTGPLKLPALNVLLLMTPLATVQCVFCAFITGEVQRAHLAFLEGRLDRAFGFLLLVNALVAFLLNIISLQTNKMAGAVTMTVAGNIKQVLTIFLGIIIFRVHTNVLSAAGIIITVIGAAWYSKVDLETKRGSS